MDEREVAWRIDAWDSLAGRAFLSRRQPDRDTEADLDQAALFVSPPFYQPEPLASRAPGFAASRGTFQAGLFLDGEEVGFATLADAIEFVRRGYMSGREFPDPTAPLTTPRPISGGGGGVALELPLERIGTAGRKLDSAIARLVSACHDAVKFQDERRQKNGGRGLMLTAAAVCSWKLDETTRAAGFQDMLEFAGIALAQEMIERLPDGDQPDDRAVWLEAFARLKRLLVAVAVWPSIEPRLHSSFDGISRDYPIRVAKLADFLGLSSNRDVMKNYLFSHVPGFHGMWRIDEVEISDPYDDLMVIPLPRAVVEHYRIADTEPNVLTALCAWFGHVADVKCETLDRALLVFAAACTVASPLRLRNEAFRGVWLYNNNPLRQQFLTRLAHDAWDWLSAQMPKRVFDRELEALLRRVPLVWAAANTPPTPAPPAPLAPRQPGLSSAEVAQLISELGESLMGDVPSTQESGELTQSSAVTAREFESGRQSAPPPRGMQSDEVRPELGVEPALRGWQIGE